MLLEVISRIRKNRIEMNRWSREARALTECSKYASKISPLLDNPSLGKTASSGDCWEPNCFGSVFYLLGFNEERVPIERDYLAHFLKEHCEPKKIEDGIVSFWRGNRIVHAGIYLGVAGGLDTLFHQPNTGENYVLQKVSKAFTFEPDNINIEYHYPLGSAKSFRLPQGAFTPPFCFF